MCSKSLSHRYRVTFCHQLYLLIGLADDDIFTVTNAYFLRDEAVRDSFYTNKDYSNMSSVHKQCRRNEFHGLVVSFEKTTLTYEKVRNLTKEKVV